MCMYTPISHVISRKFSSVLLSCHIYSHNLIESHETKQCWAFYFFTHNFASKILSVTIFFSWNHYFMLSFNEICSHSIFSVLFYLEVFYFINNVKWQFFFPRYAFSHNYFKISHFFLLKNCCLVLWLLLFRCSFASLWLILNCNF